MHHNHILIGHGSGGRLSRELIEEIFVSNFSNHHLNTLNDAANLIIDGENIAFTTDSYVIDPIFFPGGDIGQLAVSGTVNDLAVSGAVPKFLSAGFIIEEGLPISDLEKIARSMSAEAKTAGVNIVTGDTKVVKRGQCDKLFINTSGIGIIPEGRKHLNDEFSIEPEDRLIVTGYMGDHAIAILSAREKLQLDQDIKSDAAPLNQLTETILSDPSDIRFMRDITRGGLATVLVELCENKQFGIQIEESAIPIRKSVQSICDLYGFDPLYLANEGKILIVVKAGRQDKILELLKAIPTSRNAEIIGKITRDPGRAILNSRIGGKRMIDMLSGEMLPRIC